MPFRFAHGSLIAALLALPAWTFQADGFQDAFQRGVELLRKGDDAGALKAFQEALAADPSSEAAYELWRNTDNQVWLEMLAKSGDFELISKRFMSLASLGRKARTDDAEAIRGLLGEIAGGDAVARRTATRTLASDHGEYAVPHMIPTLADPVEGDRRVLFMNALAQMGDNVVLPLVAAMGSPDAFLRRNVALTLGYIGDRRAAGALAAAAAHDTDETARKAATDALAKCGGKVDPVAFHLESAAGYQSGNPSILQPHQYSDVTWNWAEDGLVAARVPRALYPDEMARSHCYAAMALAAEDPRAYAGLAAALGSELAIVRDWARAGEDTTALQAQADEAALTLDAIGSVSLDQGLAAALKANDEGAAIALAQTLGRTASAPGAALLSALASSSGALRSESAIALARIAIRSRTSVDATVVTALGEAASREVLRIAALADSDDARAATVATALEAKGYSVTRWSGGAAALAGLRRVPGVDVVVLADKLRDLLPIQVLDALRDDDRTKNVPVVLLTADAEAAQAEWADKVGAIVAADGDWSAIDGLVGERENADREEAQRLSIEAAGLLAALASSGTDVSAALEKLTGAVSSPVDGVAAPAALALGHVGGPEHSESLLAIANDTARSPAVRVAAAEAVAELTTRHANGGETALMVLVEQARSKDASMELRAAAARTIGRMNLPPAARATALRDLRVDLRVE